MASLESGAGAGAPRDSFATTRWTVVLAAGRGSSPQADFALEELCRTYWYPLYAYVRHQGHSKEDSEDLTQAFFARFLQKNYLEGLSSEKGKFRAFLLAALKHFLANERDRAARQKRGGGAQLFSLDWQDADSRFKVEPGVAPAVQPVAHRLTACATVLNPEKLYDRAWAVTLLERVITRLRDENAAEGKARLFEQLKPFLMAGQAGSPRYAQAAAGLGMSEGAVRVAVHRLRRRYRELLRDEVAQTVSDAAEIEQEMQALFSAFGD